MLKKLGSLVLCTLTLVATMPLSGCTASAAQIQGDGAALAQALNSLAAVETTEGNTEAAANLTKAADAMLAATKNWSTGTPTAIITDAANVAEIALAAIPQTAAIAPFIPIAVAALDVLLANIPGAAVAPNMRGVAPMYSSFVPAHKLGRSKRGDFIAAWNETVREHPSVGVKPLSQSFRDKVL